MKMLTIFISLLSMQAFAAQSSDFIGAKSLSPALNWEQARIECTRLGDGWDLPTLDQAMSDHFSTELNNPLKVRDLKSQKTKTYFLAWVRSNEEDLNQQFIDESRALKIDSESKNIDEYPMSFNRILVLSKYLGQLIEEKNNISRSDSDQSKLLSFLEQYHSTVLGAMYRIDEDVPMSEQENYVLMLPESVLPYEILVILSKPSARYVQTQIDNMQFEVSSISSGIEVVCVQTESF